MVRVKAFDWLRGFSVLVMFQTHSMMLLLPELRSGLFFRWVNALDGLVAPAFLLTAGFALALVNARTPNPAQWMKSFKRIAQVLLLATLINAIWFRRSFWHEPTLLLRLDILQCLGLSMMLLLGMLIAFSKLNFLTRDAGPAVFVVISFTLFTAAPFTEQVGAPFNFVLNVGGGSPFPLMPWCAYVFLGAACGLITAQQKSLNWFLLAVSAIGFSLFALRPVLEWVYPEHDFWVTNIASCGHRWGRVLALALVFRWLEVRAAPTWSATPIRGLEFFSSSSLAAYFVHQMLLFAPGPLSFSNLGRDRLSWTEMAMAVVLLISLTAIVIWLYEFVQKARRERVTSS